MLSNFKLSAEKKSVDKTQSHKIAQLCIFMIVILYNIAASAARSS